MTLHEAVEEVLKENKRPLTAGVIASIINSKGYYIRSDEEPLDEKQVISRVKNYPSVFQNINGHVILVQDENWRNILTSYMYLVNTLRGIYNVPDVQFIISVLLFYKRLIDINDRPGRKYPLDFDYKLGTTIGRMNDGGKALIEGLGSLESLHIAPEGIFDECSRLLSKLERSKLMEIWDVIRRVNTKDFEDVVFGSMFEYLLTLDSIGKYKSSIDRTPFGLQDLMVNLLDPITESSIYDPVAGIGGMLIQAVLHLKEGKYITKGSEINKRIAQLGNMNLLMHGIQDIVIEAKDCFEEYRSHKRYDYIIGDLPANGVTNSSEHRMLYTDYGLEAPKSGKSFGSLVLFVLSRLQQNGKAVLTVSDGFLVKKGKEKEIRDLLIRQDVIESVVSLPHGTLRPYTDAKASLLILNRNKTGDLKDRIQFVTAETTEQDAKSITLNNQEIIRVYKSHTISKLSQVIDVNDLRPDTNLSADAYDAEYILGSQMLKEGTAKLLSDLVEIRSGIQPAKVDVDKEGDIPLVKIENLSKDILDLNLTKEIYHKVHSNPKYLRSALNQECILLARIGDSIKPTIYNAQHGIPVIIPHRNVYALLPSRKGVDINIEYLYYQLHSSFVQEQIEKRRLGAVMPYISIAGLKQIVIPYIKPDAQISFVESQKANLIAEERSRFEERIKALDYKEEVKQTESDIIKTLTHQLRPTFLGINNIVNRIERTIKRANLSSVKEYGSNELANEVDPEIAEHIKKPDNYSLQELLEKLSGDSKHLSDILSNVDKVMNFKLSPEDLKEVDILELLKNYKQQKEIEVNDNYTILIKGESARVSISEAAFKELLDQLLSNAERHGFSQEHSLKAFRVQFVVRNNKQRGVATIEYSNNGKPYELTERDFISAFEKGKQSVGSGIGGNYIFRIVDAHHGKIVVSENYSKGFYLTIELPTIQTIGYE